jgi:VWFA-related protein
MLAASLAVFLVGNMPAQTPNGPAAQSQPGAQSPAAPAASAPANAPTSPNASPGSLPKAAPISVDVSVVNLLASVRDKHGKLVLGLTKDDFLLQQDGHPETIKYFSQDANLPLTLGLLVDTSMSQRRVLDQERAASRTFVDHALREDRDKAFLIHFDREVELLQDLTPSRQKLEAAMEQLGAPQFSNTSSSDPDSNSGGGRGGRGGGYHGGGTLLYDAIYLASDEVIKKQQGRKALVVLSDGVDRGSKESLSEAIGTAQRADTMVYSIYFVDKDSGDRGGGFGGPRMGGGMGGGGMGGGGMGRGGGGYPRRQEERPDGKKILQQISRETGGRFFEVSKKETIDDIYSAIDEELRNQYSIGYTPDKADANYGYHKLQLATKNKDLVVQTREGFYIGQ